jgi:hypothetical protein
MDPGLITGVWIRWLDLLTACFTTTRNHNQSSPEPFFLDCRGLVPFTVSFYDSPDFFFNRIFMSFGTDHLQRTQFFYCCVRICWWCSHVIATQPVHWCVCCCLATVWARTTWEHRSCIAGRVFVWTCLPSNGVFWLHSWMLWANASHYLFKINRPYQHSCNQSNDYKYTTIHFTIL